MVLTRPSLIGLHQISPAQQKQLPQEVLDLPFAELLEHLEKAAQQNKLAIFEATALSQQQWQRIRRLAKAQPMRVVVLSGSTAEGDQKRFRQWGLKRFYILDEQSPLQWEKPKSWQQQEKPPFDIIGDVHGCIDELRSLLKQLGYRIRKTAAGYQGEHPEQRRLIFVGDLVDRGPNSAEVLRLVMDLHEQGVALVVPGNHDDKLMRRLMGRKTNLRYGLAETLEQLQSQADASALQQRILQFLKNLPDHLLLDEGRLVVAHAGLKEAYHGRLSGVVRAYCLYGEVTGKKDDAGLPIRYNWAKGYRGSAYVLYGHSPVLEASWQNKTMDLDTGCCFGGHLTALRYPEMEVRKVRAFKTYAQTSRPLSILPNEP